MQITPLCRTCVAYHWPKDCPFLMITPPVSVTPVTKPSGNITPVTKPVRERPWFCGVPMTPVSQARMVAGTGRPKVYASRAEQQRAYRARRRASEEEHDASRS